MGHAKLSEESKLVTLVVPRDIGTADQTSSYVSASGYGKFRAKLATGALTSGQTAFVELMQAKAGGTNGKILGTQVAVTAPAEGQASAELEVEANIDDLDSANGFVEIGARCGAGTNGILGSVQLQMGEPDYKPIA